MVYSKRSLSCLITAVLLLAVGCLNSAWAQTAPAMGTARNFAVLGASTVTNTGATSITGDVGVSPGSAIVGFPPGTVTRNNSRRRCGSGAGSGGCRDGLQLSSRRNLHQPI